MGEKNVTEQNAVQTFLAAIRKFNAALDIPKDLSEMGAKEKDIRYYAEMSLKDVAGITNPRKATLDDLIQLIRTSMGMKSGEKPEWEYDEPLEHSEHSLHAALADITERENISDYSHFTRL